MKTLSIILLLATQLSLSVSAQKITEDKVPAAVKTTFKSKFPKATETKWEMESKTEYEVDFLIEKMKYSAKFDQNGKWLETENEISVASLPKVVSDAIAKEIPAGKIEEAEKAETSDKGTIYEVEVKNGKKEYEVVVNSNGKILKKEEEHEKHGENDEKHD